MVCVVRLSGRYEIGQDIAGNERTQRVARRVRTGIKNSELVNSRRQMIVARAIELFLKNSYHATTTNEIASACGMSEGSLYRYIGSKQDILHLIAQATLRSSGILERRLEDASRNDVVTALREYIRERITAKDQVRDQNMFLNREIQNFPSEDRRALLQSVVTNVRSFERLLTKGVELGIFKVRSPLLLAHHILMFGQNWSQRRWFLGQHFTLEEYVRLCTEDILDLILVDGVDCHGVANSGGEDVAPGVSNMATT